MVGYSEESKGYRLYNPNRKEIQIKRNVWFDEGFENTNSSTFSQFPFLLEKDEHIDTNVLEKNMISSTKGKEVHDEDSSSSDDEDTRNKRKTQSIQEVYQEGPKIVAKYALMAKVIQVETPSTFEEAKGKDEWEEAMQEEYNSLMKNGTWELATLPNGKNVVSCK